MANYNTFVVVDCESRKSILTTSSARKAGALLEKGRRVEIWKNNEKTKTIYFKNKTEILPYIEIERKYIGDKQRLAEERNKQRRRRREALNG